MRPVIANLPSEATPRVRPPRRAVAGVNCSTVKAVPAAVQQMKHRACPQRMGGDSCDYLLPTDTVCNISNASKCHRDSCAAWHVREGLGTVP
jgi:hypothetical protein